MYPIKVSYSQDSSCCHCTKWVSHENQTLLTKAFVAVAELSVHGS